MKKVLLISFRIILLIVMVGSLLIALAIDNTSHSSRTENYPLWTIFMVSLLFFLFSFLFNRKTGKDLFD
jgi:hypothetical protein